MKQYQSYGFKQNTPKEDNEKVIWLSQTYKITYSDYKQFDNDWCN